MPSPLAHNQSVSYRPPVRQSSGQSGRRDDVKVTCHELTLSRRDDTGACSIRLQSRRVSSVLIKSRTMRIFPFLAFGIAVMIARRRESRGASHGGAADPGTPTVGSSLPSTLPL